MSRNSYFICALNLTVKVIDMEHSFLLSARFELKILKVNPASLVYMNFKHGHAYFSFDAYPTKVTKISTSSDGDYWSRWFLQMLF